MEDKDKKIRYRNVLISFIVLLCFCVLVGSFLKYYIRKDFLLVDKIPCSESELNCFESESEGDKPYKILLMNTSFLPGCIDKELCDFNLICAGDDPKLSKCKIISCLSDKSQIPEGFIFSNKCVTE